MENNTNKAGNGVLWFIVGVVATWFFMYGLGGWGYGGGWMMGGGMMGRYFDRNGSYYYVPQGMMGNIDQNCRSIMEQYIK